MPNPKSSTNRRGFFEMFMTKKNPKDTNPENNDQSNTPTNCTDRREFIARARDLLIGLGLGKIFWPTDVFAQTAIKKLRFLADSDEKAFEKAVAKFAKKTGLMEAQAKALFKFDIKRNPKNGLTTATITKRKPLRFLANSNEEALEKAIKKLAKKAGISERQARDLFDYYIQRDPKNGLTTVNVVAKPSENDEIDRNSLILAKTINEHRIKKGLPPIPISPSLMKVAKTHAIDFVKNQPGSGKCNLHSWSDKGNWSPCCYTSDHAMARCMWNKPRELTSYKGSGYEISAAGISPRGALRLWQGSHGHYSVIIEKGKWHNANWQAMGAGHYKGYAVVWFGHEKDEAK